MLTWRTCWILDTFGTSPSTSQVPGSKILGKRQGLENACFSILLEVHGSFLDVWLALDHIFIISDLFSSYSTNKEEKNMGVFIWVGGEKVLLRRIRKKTGSHWVRIYWSSVSHCKQIVDTLKKKCLENFPCPVGSVFNKWCGQDCWVNVFLPVLQIHWELLERSIWIL
jgi:hypothetical protein